MSETSAREREILMVMRKVLTSIVKDTTPAHRSMKHPLSAGTIEDIRQCLGLISARERELAEAAGIAAEKPYFSDQARSAEVVSIGKIGRRKKSSDEEAQ